MKNNIFVKVGLLLCTAIFCFAIGLAGASTNVQASEASLFKIVDGASIRAKDPNGIRFSADYSKDLFVENSETITLKDGYEAGILLVQTQTLQGELVKETVGVKDVKALVWGTIENDASNYRLNAVLTDIPETEFGTFVTARAYLKSGDDIYYSQTVTRNVAQVASIAMTKGYTGSVFENYIDKVNPQITLPQEVDAEGNVTLLFGQSITYAVAPEYLVATVTTTVADIVEVTNNTITAIGAGTTEVTIQLGTLTKTINVSVVGGVGGNVDLGESAFIWQIEGQGVQTLEGNLYTTDFNTRNALMLDMNNTGAHTLSARDFVVEAEMPIGTAHPNAGREARGGVLIYTPSRWMVAYYYNNNDANKVYYYQYYPDGTQGWMMETHGGEYDCDIFLPEADTSEKVTIYVEKIGTEIRLYGNGQYLRTFKDDAWANAQIGFESKYTERTITLKQYRVINKFAPLNGYWSNMNVDFDGVNKYTFKESTNGYWANAGVTSFDGGAMHFSLVYAKMRNYEFDTTVKLSQAQNASGTIGVIGAWIVDSFKSWIEIGHDGVINVWGHDSIGYMGEKTLADFGLTVQDEIPIKVIKNGITVSYYINDILVHAVQAQPFYDYYLHVGIFGISPAPDNSNGGQYGAEFKVINLATINGIPL